MKRLSRQRLRRLARRRGFDDGKASVEEVGRWLLDSYAKDLSRTVGEKRHELVDRARKSVKRVKLALKLPVEVEQPPPEPPPVDLVPNTIPTDPALRTATLAGVYEKQDMTVEALTIYHELAEKHPDDPVYRDAIERLDSQGSEQPDGLGPSVGGDVYEPVVAKAGGGPVDLPDLDDLPQRYGVDEAVLMMVTPALMYAFWEITPETEDRVRREAGDGRLVLRIYRVLVEEGRVGEEVARDLDVPSTAGEYFIHDMPSGTLFRAAVGLLVGDGFHPMVLTHAAATPSDGPSGRVDEEWMEVDQSALDHRGKESLSLEVATRHRLSPREMALLRLHEMGALAYGSRTGVDAERLRRILLSGPRRIRGIDPLPGASDSLERIRE